MPGLSSSVTATQNGSGNLTTPAVASRAGDIIVVAVQIPDYSTTVTSVSDGNNSYSRKAQVREPGTPPTGEVWIATNVKASASNTITVTLSAIPASTWAVAVGSYNGVVAVDPSLEAANTLSSTVVSASISPQSSTGVIIVCVMLSTAETTSNLTAGYSDIPGTGTSSLVHQSYLLEGIPGANNFTETLAGSNQTFAFVAISLAVSPWSSVPTGGKPFVTVSPIGLNSTPVAAPIANNGADFGPDTSGTSTSGINEALSAIAPTGAAAGAMVLCLPGTYTISSSIAPQSNGVVLVFSPGCIINSSAAFVFSPTGGNDRLTLIGNGCQVNLTTGASAAFNLYQITSLLLQGFVVNGLTSPGSAYNMGVYLNAGCTGTIRDVVLNSCGNVSVGYPGFKISSNVSGNPNHDILVENVRCTPGTIVISTDVKPPTGGDQSYRIRVVNCSSVGRSGPSGSVTDGLDVIHARDVDIIGFMADSPWSNGIAIGINTSTTGYVTQDIRIIGGGCRKSGGSGLVLGQGNTSNTETRMTVIGWVSVDCGQGKDSLAKDQSGIVLYAQYCEVSGCICYDDQTSPNQTQLYGITEMSTSANNRVISNILTGNSTGASGGTQASSLWSENQGYNPQGFASGITPTFPGPGIDQPNSQPFPVEIYISGTGSGISAYRVTDPSGTFQSFTVNVSLGTIFRLDPGAKIRFTYTGTPAWVWYGI